MAIGLLFVPLTLPQGSVAAFVDLSLPVLLELDLLHPLPQLEHLGAHGGATENAQVCE